MQHNFSCQVCNDSDPNVVVFCLDFSYDAVINASFTPLCSTSKTEQEIRVIFCCKFRSGGGGSGHIFPHMIAGCNTEVIAMLVKAFGEKHNAVKVSLGSRR